MGFACGRNQCRSLARHCVLCTHTLNSTENTDRTTEEPKNRTTKQFCVATFFVVWGVALPCCHLRCRQLPFSDRGLCPWPDPRANFQHFLDGIFSSGDHEFVTVRGHGTGLLRFVSKMLVDERELQSKGSAQARSALRLNESSPPRQAGKLVVSSLERWA